VLSTRHVKCCEPLICIVVELHAVALLPAVERATQLDHLEAGASIVEFEGVSGPLLHDTIELRRSDAAFKGLMTSFSPEVHIIQLIQIMLLCANDLLDNVDRRIHLWAPLAE